MDLDHAMCEVPQCLLDALPGEPFREQDEECQCADPPQCRQPAPMSCGMCTPKYPQGWEHGKCINLCMDGSDGWVDGSANEPGKPAHFFRLPSHLPIVSSQVGAPRQALTRSSSTRASATSRR